jgi:hypothetical protein
MASVGPLLAPPVSKQTTLTPSDSNQMETLQVNEQITPTTTIKRHRAAGKVRHHPRSLKTTGVEVHSSSRTSTSTHNPDQHPATSPQKSHETAY